MRNLLSWVQFILQWLKGIEKERKLNNLNNMNKGDGKKKETLNGTLKENLSIITQLQGWRR